MMFESHSILLAGCLGISALAGQAAPGGTAGPAAESPAQEAAAVEKGLLFHFHDASLESVLEYMSQAAGFIIIMETKVEGKVEAWSQQPLSKDEAVTLLDTLLDKHGYAAIRNGRTLTIVDREEAKKRDIPVKTGSDPEAIPRNQQIVTQILPVRYANATQLTKDLLPLLPSFASMTANESGNALVITDTQADIKRMAKIVKALDTSIAGISSIRIFTLRFADAKDLASIVKELYPTQNSSGNNNSGNTMPGFFGQGGGGPGGGAGGPGGPGGGGNAAGASSQGGGQSEARQAASRVVATADDRTNSLIVGAPDSILPAIERLVLEIDTNAEQITEMRIFRLHYADPVEMADLLSNLFPDETKSDSDRSAVQFRGGMGGGVASTSSDSTRAKKKTKVSAVADQRTASVIVSAASELMPHIASVVADLDANPAKKQKVFVMNLNNASVTSVQTVLQDLFQSQNSGNSSSSSQTSDPLSNRSLFNQGTGANGLSSGSSSSSSSTRGGN